MADFKMTFHSDETFKIKFSEPEEDFVIKFEEMIEHVTGNVEITVTAVAT